MHPRLAADLDGFAAILRAAAEAGRDAVAAMDGRAVAPVLSESAADPGPVPVEGVGAVAALERFGREWEPGFAASAGPRFLGFVTGGATPASVAGDWVTSVHDQNAASIAGSSAAALERVTVAWLADMLGLGGHTGAFVSGATMSNFTGLAIGREWLGERAGFSVAQEGAGGLAVRVLSGTPHSSVFKALAMLGVGRGAVRVLPTAPGREAVDLAALEDALREGPAIVVANAGTVNTVDFDDLRAIAALRERYPFWLHVDAAFGGFAALSPRHAHLVAGIEAADSVCVDLHKWLNVPYDSAVQFTRRRDLQARVFRNSAAYLTESGGGEPDFLHLTPENSRRLRALPAWFALTAYGTQGHREIVERDVDCARALGARLEADARWRLLAPVRLNVVCFGPADGRPLDPILRALAPEAFLTPTVYEGVPALRAAFSNWRTTLADVDRVYAALSAL
ncbi:pyridoxal phosphate-dependent decarboxylase family protein [Spirillospora sp. CA-294931]|uniref:pyridoxal phosphate-dependent decarboxylase family protein n=1 Tax=Spirillospora sp. CA-294931 TaxID=3240042 RepID=UPI003D8E4EA8